MNNGCPIDKDGYLVFDSLTIRQKIKDMLNESGVIKDANYEGSNIANIIDIVSYTFNVLMFYLNKTSSEGMFSEAQLYDNMNRIVKLLDYKPVGRQTATLSILMSADSTGETVETGLYTIPRYSFFQLEGVPYSFNEDITFAKSVSGMEYIEDVSTNKLLFQGKYEEYPIYTSVGQENEIVYLTPGDNVIIDHFNIDVYVKSRLTETWQQWEKTNSLYLENANAKKFEIRFNENKNYEIKFGNNINGMKLEDGDQVAIYYLRSKGSDGEVGINVLSGKVITRYQTTQFNTILEDVVQDQYSFLDDYSSLKFDNTSVSTFSSTEESVDEIRQNAPSVFRSQYRLVTEDDYEKYVRTNFANIIYDVAVANNWKYLSENMKYYYDLGISKPEQVSRVLYNQVMFADACNFNNIYIISVPKVSTNNKDDYSFLSPAQKELIISSMKSEKLLTSEIILLDPVYMAITPYITNTGNNIDVNDVDNTEIYIIKDSASRRDTTSIKNDVNNIFLKYFTRDGAELGQVIDVKQLTTDILSINGVKKFYTRRKDTDTRIEGLSLLVWNNVYQDDANVITGNLSLEYFKFPYLYDRLNFVNRITVDVENKIYENVEY